MVWRVDREGGSDVGGIDARRLTPDFRLREFRRAESPRIGLEPALETAFSVPSLFRRVTGNFGGAGLSFGPAGRSGLA